MRDRTSWTLALYFCMAHGKWLYCSMHIILKKINTQHLTHIWFSNKPWGSFSNRNEYPNEIPLSTVSSFAGQFSVYEHMSPTLSNRQTMACTSLASVWLLIPPFSTVSIAGTYRVNTTRRNEEKYFDKICVVPICWPIYGQLLKSNTKKKCFCVDVIWSSTHFLLYVFTMLKGATAPTHSLGLELDK